MTPTPVRECGRGIDLPIMTTPGLLKQDTGV
jgi:hypothetical protein